MLFDVSVWDDGFCANDASFGVVESIEQDGYFCFEGNIVESFLPVCLCFACAFGGDAKPECAAVSRPFCNDVCGVHLFASVDGNASEFSHQDAHRPEEPLFLHEEVASIVFSAAIKVPDNEVPVARVGCECDDTFWW